jgi:long-chain acyl-CoA synthetase
MTAFKPIAKRFAQCRDQVLLSSSDRQITYGQALWAARELAISWKKEGAKTGDAVALVLNNNLTFPCCYLACMVGGFVAVPVNPELGTDMVSSILALVRPRITIDQPPSIELSGRVVSDFEADAVPEQCGAIFFTSGTTGRPKGVRHTWSSLIGNAFAFNQAMGIGPDARMCHVLPMAYMAGFLNTVLSPLAAGGTVLIGQRFSPTSVLHFWQQEACRHANIMWLTPSIAAALIGMVRAHDAALAAAQHFRTILCGTASLPFKIRTEFRSLFGRALQESYGTSELLLISAQSYEEADGLMQHVGSPLPQLDLKFRKFENAQDEILVRSPFALLNYLTEEGLLSVADAAGYVSTGDSGALRNGALYITGRIKDLIIRGGVNVAPILIEDTIRQISGVGDVAVVGVPHDFWGEAIVAYVEPVPGSTAEQIESAIRQLCRTRLARAHQPDRIAFIAKLPRASNGKVQKHALRQNAPT